MERGIAGNMAVIHARWREAFAAPVVGVSRALPTADGPKRLCLLSRKERRDYLEVLERKRLRRKQRQLRAATGEGEEKAIFLETAAA